LLLTVNQIAFVVKIFDFVVRSMRGVADTRVRVRKYTRREYKVKVKPWITQGMICSIKHRDYLFRIYKKSKTTNGFPNVQKIPKPTYSCQSIS